jgi:ADP-heptose:LPS heptosyltransferase
MYSQDPPAGEAGLESFTKEEPVSETQDQFKFTQNDLPTEERKVIVLNPSTSSGQVPST